MSKSVPSPHKCREAILDRSFEDIKAQVVAIVAQRPGIDVARLAVACRLPLVGPWRLTATRRLGAHTVAMLERLAAEGVIQLVEPCALYPQTRVFPPSYRPRAVVTERRSLPCRSWVDPSQRGVVPREERDRALKQAHWNELNRQQFGEQA